VAMFDDNVLEDTKLDGSGTMEARKLEEDEEEDDDGDITLETESVVW